MQEILSLRKNRHFRRSILGLCNYAQWNLPFLHLGKKKVSVPTQKEATAFWIEPNTSCDDDGDPLDASCSTTAGFDSSFPLEENEIDLVYDMMLISLLVNTVIVGACDKLPDGGETLHIENTP